MSDHKVQTTVSSGDSKEDPITAENVAKKEPLNTSMRIPMATIQDDDERLLARIGYRQVSIR